MARKHAFQYSCASLSLSLQTCQAEEGQSSAGSHYTGESMKDIFVQTIKYF